MIKKTLVLGLIIIIAYIALPFGFSLWNDNIGLRGQIIFAKAAESDDEAAESSVNDELLPDLNKIIEEESVMSEEDDPIQEDVDIHEVEIVLEATPSDNSAAVPIQLPENYDETAEDMPAETGICDEVENIAEDTPDIGAAVFPVPDGNKNENTSPEGSENPEPAPDNAPEDVAPGAGPEVSETPVDGAGSEVSETPVDGAGQIMSGAYVDWSN